MTSPDPDPTCLLLCYFSVYYYYRIFEYRSVIVTVESEGMTEHSPSEGMTEDAVGGGESLDPCNIVAQNVRRKRLRMHRPAKQLPPSDKLLVISETTSSSSSSLSSSPDSSSFSPVSSPESLPEIEEEKEQEEEEDDDEEEKVTCLSHGVASVMGRRREMEDTARAERGFFVFSDCGITKSRKKKKRSKLDYFAVFDGHGGESVAALCRNRMHRILEDEIQAEMSEGNDDDDDNNNNIQEVDWEKVMLRGFEKMDEEVVGCCGASASGLTVGSTAVVALVGAKEVVVANCGDSRAVICRNGVAFPLSDDHKPGRPDELARIEAAGGKVINWNGNRVLGVLATSRSIGDNYLKPYVISRPEVTVSRRTEEDEFLILASDGLWDVVSNEVACQVTRRCLDGRLTLRRRGEAETVVATASSSSPSAVERDENDQRASDAASLLVQLALARGSRDNISVVVAQLNRPLKQTRSSST